MHMGPIKKYKRSMMLIEKSTMSVQLVHCHFDRADGLGHVPLESKNSAKYKQYLELVLR